MVKYSIKKDNYLGCHVIWKEIEREKGYGCKIIFQGKKQECEEKLDKLKKESN